MRKRTWTEAEQQRVALITGKPVESIEEGKYQLEVKLAKKHKSVSKLTLDDWIVFTTEARNMTFLQQWNETLEPETEITNSMVPNKKTLNAIKYFLTGSGYSIYRDVHKLLSINKNFIVVVDAPPGTGKTGFLRLLGMSLVDKKNKVFCANANNVTSSMSRVGTVELNPPILNNFTICKLLQVGFGLTYDEAVKWFKDSKMISRDKHTSDVEEMYRYYTLIFRYKWKLHGPQSLLILDEYTLTAPALIYVFLILAKKYKFSLLFTGDSKQITAIDKSRFHNKGNYDLISRYASSYTLTEQKRMVPDYYARFGEIQKIMNEYGSVTDIKFDFRFKYITFLSFFNAYFGEPNYDSIYFAATHKKITERVDRHTAILQEKGSGTVDVYFKIRDMEMSTEEVSFYRELRPTPEQAGKLKYNKYLLRVPLTINRYYWYHPKSTPKAPIVVKLLKFEDGACTVSTYHRNIVHKLYPVKYISVMLTKDYCNTLLEMAVEQGITDLHTAAEHTRHLFENYPLTPLCSTFHNAQGCTIENITIDVDLDVKTTNEMYMVLSRVKETNQLNYIATKALWSLIYTHYRQHAKGELSHYYRLVRVDDEIRRGLARHASRCVHELPFTRLQVLDEITFEKVDKMDLFERAKVNVVISIECYVARNRARKTKLTEWYEHTSNQMDTFYSTKLSYESFAELFNKWND